MTIKAFLSLSRAAPLDGWFRSVLMILVIFSGGSVLVAQAGPFPPAGDDGFSSMGKFRISIQPNFGGGSVTADFTGPTCILRSDPHLQGADPSGILGDGAFAEPDDLDDAACVALGLPNSAATSAATSDIEIEPIPLDFNSGKGKDEVHTEMAGMRLDGSGIRLWAGAPLFSQLGINCPVKSHMQRNLERSLGEVESIEMAGGFEADSFFNLFVMMEVGPPYLGLPDFPSPSYFFNPSPLTVRVHKPITGFPPFNTVYMHGWNLSGKTRFYDCEYGCYAATLEKGSHGVGDDFSAVPLARSRVLNRPIVFSVDKHAEGLLHPHQCHPDPQDVYTFGIELAERTEGELFQGGNVSNSNLKLRRALGLVEEDNIISLSFGQDDGRVLLFSVDPDAEGEPRTAVEFNDSKSPVEEIPLAGIDPTKIPSNGGGDPGSESAGDIYVSREFSKFGPKPEEVVDVDYCVNPNEYVIPAKTSKNVIGFDESSLGLQAPAINHSIGKGPSEDDLDALEISTPLIVDGNEDSIIDPKRFVFFTLSEDSPSLKAPDSQEYKFKANDILVATAPEIPDQFTFDIYAYGIDDDDNNIDGIGLLEGDVIDALVLWDDVPYGRLSEKGELEQDEALFSLAAGSPSLKADANLNILNPDNPGDTGPFSPGDVFRIKFVDRYKRWYRGEKKITLYASASELGLREDDTVDENGELIIYDELNALDIAPTFIPSSPPCSVTLLDNAFSTTVSNGTVNLAWETASEDNNAGFVVWRGKLKADKTECSQNMDDYTEVRPLNPKKEDLVVAIGSGSPYSYQDQEVTSGNTYCYALEDVELKGKRIHHLDSIISASIP